MPWHKVHTGGKWKVVKDADGKIVGTHDTEADANEQLAALYASEKRTLGDVTLVSWGLDPHGLGTIESAKTVQRVHRDDDRRSR